MPAQLRSKEVRIFYKICGNWIMILKQGIMLELFLLWIIIIKAELRPQWVITTKSKRRLNQISNFREKVRC